MNEDSSCEVCAFIDQHSKTLGDGEPTVAHEHARGHHVTKVIRNENDLLRNLQRKQDEVADVITKLSGSMRFVYAHSLWFALWIVANAGVFGSSFRFDAYPFGLLTLIVSLEAIFLSTFVMLSQNRQAKRADLRAELDYETNIRSEIWSLHIGQKLGIDATHVEDAVDKLIAEARASD